VLRNSDGFIKHLNGNMKFIKSQNVSRQVSFARKSFLWLDVRWAASSAEAFHSVV